MPDVKIQPTTPVWLPPSALPITLALLMGSCSPSGAYRVSEVAAGRSPNVHLDLTARLTRARTLGASFEFTEEERRLGLLSRGWTVASEAPGRPSFAWAQGRRADLDVELGHPRDRWLVFRGWSPSSERAQRAHVFLNERPVESLELGSRPAVHAVRLAADAQGLGENRISLRFDWSEPDQSGRPARAAAFDWLVISDDDDEPTEVGPTPRAPRAAASGFRQRAGGELIFRVSLPAGAGLELAGSGDAAVSLRRAGRMEPLVGARDLRGGARVHVDLSPLAGSVVDIGFAALHGEVLWQRPVITGDQPAPVAPPNVVVIVADTLRADYVSSYGSPLHTPNIDRLAKTGLRFARAYSAAASTVPAHSSLFTGLQPSQHGALTNDHVLGGGNLTTAEVLAERGMHTAAFVSLGVLQDIFGLDQGFAEYRDHFGTDWWRTGDEISDAAIEWLQQGDRAPYFLWLHYSEPPEPYSPPGRASIPLELTLGGRVVGRLATDERSHSFPVRLARAESDVAIRAVGSERRFRIAEAFSFDDAVRAECRVGCDDHVEAGGSAKIVLVNRSDDAVDTQLVLRASPVKTIEAIRDDYAAEVEFLDAQVGRVLDTLAQKGDLASTIVVFTSDHGEGLGDHGEIGHVNQLYDPILRVPLIVSYPEGLAGGRVVEDSVSIVDVSATLFDLMGVAAPPGWPGRSLLPLLDGETRRWPVFAATYRPAASRDLVAVVKNRFKLIAEIGGGRELYDLRVDPGEHHDQSASRASRLGSLAADLAPFLTLPVTESGLASLREEERARLRALGYVR